VSDRLRAAAGHADPAADILWSDSNKGAVLALLQDRVAQAGKFLESCRAALALVYKVIFPLNRQPQSLGDLMRRFENGTAVYGFLKRCLFCGAQVALSFIRVRYPAVDMRVVGTLPATPSGVTLLTPHYEACRDAAKLITKAIITERDREMAEEARGEAGSTSQM
jgi:hypothetical protein